MRINLGGRLDFWITNESGDWRVVALGNAVDYSIFDDSSRHGQRFNWNVAQQERTGDGTVGTVAGADHI